MVGWKNGWVLVHRSHKARKILLLTLERSTTSFRFSRGAIYESTVLFCLPAAAKHMYVKELRVPRFTLLCR